MRSEEKVVSYAILSFQNSEYKTLFVKKKNTHYVYSSALRARVRDEEQGISDNVLISIS